MKKKQTDEENNIQKNLEYLELDLNNIPKSISEFEPLDFRVPKVYEENRYRQYRYIPVKDIDILLSPTNRLNELEEKYSKARPIINYLIPNTEDNILRHTVFLNMLKTINIADIEEVDKEQKELNKKIPFKVKFPGNYLWQIYYSENTDKYFMIVPTEDSDYSTFFYLLKKKLKKRVMGKVFVPINNVEYSREFLKKSEFEDIENYLWLFTKDWPLVYEVYDKDDKLSIHIVGETEVYGKVKTSYKIKLSTKNEANQFYKLIKALFILQTELPHYFKFSTNINQYGALEFYRNNIKIEYAEIAEFIKDEYINLIEQHKKADEDIIKYKRKLEELKKESEELEVEYVEKEKQISTYLECKKTFFGKVKYFFKYGNKKTKEKSVKSNILKNPIKAEEIKKEDKDEKKERYTLEELIEEYKKYELKEIDIKNTIMDINALKLKNKNLAKKIENASLYIKEIDNHKKSIFEFWRYSNKDEVASLPEGEEEEVNVEKVITKIFDYEDDLEDFGKNMDKLQRKEISQEELDSIYITTTDVADLLADVRNGETTPKEIESSLKEQKELAEKEKTLLNTEEFDIFGGLATDSRKLKSLANHKHRELPKDKFEILEVNKTTKQLGYKLALERINEKIASALERIKLDEDVSVYIAKVGKKLNKDDINICNLNPENEIAEAVKEEENKIEFYKINLKKGVNAIAYTNIIYYDNKNKTLPIGMDLSTKILVDLSKLKLKEVAKNSFRIAHLEDEKNELSKMIIKNIKVTEYDIEE